MKCYACGKEITSNWFWQKILNGKAEYFCNDCAAERIDERTSNGFITVYKDWV